MSNVKAYQWIKSPFEWGSYPQSKKIVKFSSRQQPWSTPLHSFFSSVLLLFFSIVLPRPRVPSEYYHIFVITRFCFASAFILLHCISHLSCCSCCRWLWLKTMVSLTACYDYYVIGCNWTTQRFDNHFAGHHSAPTSERKSKHNNCPLAAPSMLSVNYESRGYTDELQQWHLLVPRVRLLLLALQQCQVQAGDALVGILWRNAGMLLRMARCYVFSGWITAVSLSIFGLLCLMLHSYNL